MYRRTAGGMRDIHGFTAHGFEGGDLIIQATPAKRGDPVEYALAHTLAEGVWLVVPIDEADADEATRKANCKGDARYSCEIERHEQLLTLARATAARRKDKDSGGLAIRLRDASRQR
jgi:hypothetical protein